MIEHRGTNLIMGSFSSIDLGCTHWSTRMAVHGRNRHMVWRWKMMELSGILAGVVAIHAARPGHGGGGSGRLSSRCLLWAKVVGNGNLGLSTILVRVCVIVAAVAFVWGPVMPIKQANIDE